MATHSTKSSPNGTMEKARALRAGAAKEIPGNAVLMVMGKQMTGAEILSKLEGAEQVCRAVQQARMAERVAMEAFRKEAPRLRQFFADFKAALSVHFGTVSPKLASFGIALPKKARTRTAAEKLLSIARAQQTRAANERAAREMSAPPEAVSIPVRPE